MQLISAIAALTRQVFHPRGVNPLEPGRGLHIVAYEPGHLKALREGAHEDTAPRLIDAEPADAEEAYSVFNSDGKIVMCCGVERIYEHWSHVWVTFSLLISESPGDGWAAFAALVGSFLKQSYLQILVPCPGINAWTKGLVRLGFRRCGVEEFNGKPVGLYILLGGAT